MIYLSAAPAAGLAEATCSNPLLAKYSSVTITSAAGATCSGTTLDGCTERTGQDYNYDGSCSMQFSSKDHNDYVTLYPMCAHRHMHPLCLLLF